MTHPPCLSSSHLAAVKGIRHGFFTRLGGRSEGVFDSLNCGLSSGDRLSHVNGNRQAVMNAVGASDLFTLKQVHSNKVRVVADDSHPEEVIEADAMVTRRKGVALGALGADCAPVLFVDPQAEIVGSAHAGWRGAVYGVTDEVIVTMCEMGARRERIVCAIGPCIQWNSYEVGDGFRDDVVAASGIPAESFFKSHGEKQTTHFDLGGYIEARIRHQGVVQVDCLRLDTYTDHDRFFSYRRNCHQQKTGYGRQISVISLTGA